jgi:hypothetical protein
MLFMFCSYLCISYTGRQVADFVLYYLSLLHYAARGFVRLRMLDTGVSHSSQPARGGKTPFAIGDYSCLTLV